MTSIVRHPALVLAALGAVSGTLGTYAPGFDYGEAPRLGVYMMLTGFWFGLVVAFGVWRWDSRAWVAAMTALAATWIAWEVAVNLAMHMTENWLKAAIPSEMFRTYVAGFAAGAIGAFLTWAGAAAFSSKLRQISVACIVASTGALFGLLLPWSTQYDGPIILFLPWQVAVAAVLGLALASPQIAHRKSRAS